MQSLRAKLTTGLSLSLVLLFALMWYGMDLSTRYLTRQFVTTRLEHDVESLQGELKRNPFGRLMLRSRHIPRIYTRPHSGHYYRIEAGNETVESASLDGFSLPPMPPSDESRLLLEAAGPAEQHLLLLYVAFPWQGRSLRMTVAEDISPLHEAQEGFALGYLLVLALALPILVFLQTWLVHRSLRSVDRTRLEVRQLEQGEIRRLSLDVPTEVRPLVKEVNDLLTDINLRLDRSRKALGNLTHAIKTPLTLLTDLADRPEFATYPALRDEMRQRLEAIRTLMERELKRARLAGIGSAGSCFLADREIPPLIHALRQMYRDKKVEIEVLVPDHFRCGADRQDMLELFGNLLDNACKWARKRVLLQIDPKPGLVFRIEDDGPGVADEQLLHLTARGARMDEQTPGHGLGLGIVKDIVESYDGTVKFGRSKRLGGFRVEVVLDKMGEEP